MENPENRDRVQLHLVLPYKFEPGGANHEGCAGLLGLGDYLKFLTGRATADPCDRAVIEQACDGCGTVIQVRSLIQMSI